MGAWGVLAFDNDEACDWASELVGISSLSLVDAAFKAIEDSGNNYLDAHDACNALAACEVLSRLRGNAGYNNPYTEQVDAWVASHPIEPPANILARADAVIERVLGDKSELRELWMDSEGLGTEWRESAEDLRRRMRE